MKSKKIKLKRINLSLNKNYSSIRPESFSFCNSVEFLKFYVTFISNFKFIIIHHRAIQDITLIHQVLYFYLNCVFNVY